MARDFSPDDTIAAIATATGGGIGIVRVSGPRALEIGARLVDPWPPGGDGPESHKMWRASASGDEILCVVMRAPRSYTGQDVMEIHGHGGAVSLRNVLSCVVAAGARVAEPGEFTRRAFLNGRIDLAQAEAVAQIVGARSERALRLAQANLKGALAGAIEPARMAVLGVLADLEAAIDFSEEQLDLPSSRELAAATKAIAIQVGELAGTWRRSRLFLQGISVALTGAPNVGKSSLFNRLVGHERAVVTDEPGTTRDYLEATVDWSGVAVTLIDTAGTREAGDRIEQQAIELARRRIAGADVVVEVRDAAQPAESAATTVREDLVVLNKIDLQKGQPEWSGDGPVVFTSALDGRGLEALREAVLAAAGGGEGSSEALVSTERQFRGLEASRAALDAAAHLLVEGASPDLVALEVRTALEHLDSVTGRAFEDDVLAEIFARFCIGK